MSQIFISHSSLDDAQAIALKNWLSDNGWGEVFLDLDPLDGIHAGKEWEQALEKALNDSKAMIFLVSKNWLKSEWCLIELENALKINAQRKQANLEVMPFFPMLLGNISRQDLPDALQHWQSFHLEKGGSAHSVKLRVGNSQKAKLSNRGLQALKNGLNLAGLNPRTFTWPPSTDPTRAPYRGLSPLEAEDAGIFFGRDSAIANLMAMLNDLRSKAPPRFMVIQGASGSGKSSFMRAGILPRLQRDERHFAVLPIVRPEKAVISSTNGFLKVLEEVCQRYQLPYTSAQLRQMVDEGKEAPLFAELVKAHQARTDSDEATMLVIAIDQAEELFYGDAHETEQFLTRIAELCLQIPLLVLCTIRSDSYSALQTYPALASIQQRTFPLPQITRGAYQQIIEGPANRLANAEQPLKVEPELTEQLLKDLEKDESRDSLPLLAFTLERLYLEYGDERLLELEEYQAGLGGLDGAVSKAVERALDDIEKDSKIPNDREACLALFRRGLIPWLVGINPQTKVPFRRVAQYNEIPAEARPLMDYLVEYRLLAKDTDQDGNVTIEPVHESILRQWKEVGEWLKADMPYLSALETLNSATIAWQVHERRDEWLSHYSTKLKDAEKLLHRFDFADSLKEPHRAYLSACRQTEDEREATEKAQLKKIVVRTRVGLAVALVLMLISAGLAYLANEKQKEFERELERSQKLLSQVSTTLNFLNFEVRDALNKYTPTHVRAPIIEQMQALREQLQKESPSLSSQSQREIGVSYHAQGNLAVEQGKLPQALSHYEKALIIFKKLAEEDPSNQTAQRDLSVSYNNIGETAKDQGDLAKALSSYQASLAIFKKIAEEYPSNETAQRDLSVSYNNIGEIAKDQGDLAKARSSYQASLAIFKKIAEKDPSNQTAQRDLSISYNNIGDIAKDQVDLTKARSSYQASLAIFKKIAEEDSSNQTAQRDLSLSYEKIGNIEENQGDLAKALSNYQASLAIREKIANKDPSNQTAQGDLSIAYEKIGNIARNQGDLAKALSSYQANLAILEKLTEEDPSNQKAQRDLSVSYNKIGEIAKAQGDLTKALSSYQASLAIREKIAEEDPSNQTAQRNLSVSYSNIGDIAKDQGDLAKALSSYQASLAIDKKIAEENPSNQTAQRDLSLSYDNIGNIANVQGDLAKALSSYKASLAIRKKLAEADPSNQTARRDLSLSYNNIGNIAKAQGDLAKALSSYQASLAVAKKLAEKDPSNKTAQRDLSVSYYKIGNIAKAQGDLAKALSSYQASLSIIEKLAKEDPSNQTVKRDLSVFYNNIGDIAKAQGDLAKALSSYQASLAIRDKLAEEDPSNQTAQRDLSVSYYNIGNIAKAQGYLAKALSSYQASLAILEKIANKDPSNQTAQRDLSVSYNKIGDIAKAQGNLAKALSSYQASLAIAKKLTVEDPSNQTAQRDLSVSYDKIGEIAETQGDLTRALSSYQTSLAIRKRLVDKTPSSQQFINDLDYVFDLLVYTEKAPLKRLKLRQDELQIKQKLFKNQFLSKDKISSSILEVTWYSLLSSEPNEYENAISLSEKEKELASNFPMLDTNYAHALALLGKEKEAIAVYKSHLGKMLYWSNGKEAGLWEENIINDFKSLKEEGVTSPIFDKAKKLIEDYKAKQKAEKSN